MVVDNPTMPTEAEVAVFRHEAAHRRVLAQEWAGTSMQDLIKAVAHLHTNPPADRNTPVTHLFSLCDQVGVAAEVAAATVHVAGNEHFELALHMADIDAEAAREETRVVELRKTLQRERVAGKQKEEYEALAGLILKEPLPAVSKRKLEQAREELEGVEREGRSMEEARDAMSKELACFLHCAKNLDGFSKQFAQSVGGGGAAEKEEGEKDEDEEMNTTG